jgi:hypothetical protein
MWRFNSSVLQGQGTLRSDQAGHPGRSFRSSKAATSSRVGIFILRIKSPSSVRETHDVRRPTPAQAAVSAHSLAFSLGLGMWHARTSHYSLDPGVPTPKLCRLLDRRIRAGLSKWCSSRYASLRPHGLASNFCRPAGAYIAILWASIMRPETSAHIGQTAPSTTRRQSQARHQRIEIREKEYFSC